MNAARFKAVLAELIEENPLAVRAVLKILAVEFTGEVETLAVTCEGRPRLLVNLEFLRANCRGDEETKAVILHEFLHVLLRHTERTTPITDAEHLAADAVINAVIHRTMGADYSSVMSRYYRNAKGPMRLLRPMGPGEADSEPGFKAVWQGLYQGKLVADDIREVAEGLKGRVIVGRLLGGHMESAVSEELSEGIERALRAMNGSGIWRSPRAHGAGGLCYEALFTAKDAAAERWRRAAFEVLNRHLAPDPRSRAVQAAEADYLLPVLSPRDRRAFVRSLWDGFIPEARWGGPLLRPEGSAQVYLDVSGSMNAEMADLVGLLNRLRRYIRMPFWAFSDEVAPAVIEKGQLRTRTSGGTSLACVLRHLEKTRPPAAVVVTDGFIERVPRELLGRVRGTRLHALVARGGNTKMLEEAGIAYTQLERRPG